MEKWDADKFDNSHEIDNNQKQETTFDGYALKESEKSKNDCD